MNLKELLETLEDGIDLEIYIEDKNPDYALNYHCYGKNRYIVKAYDVDFYYKIVKTIDFYHNKNGLVMKIGLIC
ncbi:MAG: hypothetical protein HUJ53_03435 [Holdemanella sp.]|nr:hypothetical protein [Holdemanella sp.]